jgi:hypothetical protein
MDNVQNCDSHINIPSSQTYTPYAFENTDRCYKQETTYRVHDSSSVILCQPKNYILSYMKRLRILLAMNNSVKYMEVAFLKEGCVFL